MRILIWTLALASLTSACASTRAVPRPFPVPGAAQAPPPEPVEPRTPAEPAVAPALPELGSLVPPSSRPGRSEVQIFDSYALVGTALALRGIPYRNGGTDVHGFDCSGFTQYVFSQFGIVLPRDVRAQYRVGKSLEPHEISPGDLVFFSTTNPDVSHVAIAIGGDGFVHAPSTWGVVRVEYLSGGYWSRRYVGAKRVGN